MHGIILDSAKLHKSITSISGDRIFRLYFTRFRTARQVSQECKYAVKSEMNPDYPTASSSVLRKKNLWLDHDYLDKKEGTVVDDRHAFGKWRNVKVEATLHRANLNFYWDLAGLREWEFTKMEKKLIERCFDDTEWRRKAAGHKGVPLSEGVTRTLQEMVATNLFRHGIHAILPPHERKMHDKMFGIAFPDGPRLALENGDLARVERFIDKADRATAGMEESHRSILWIMSLPPKLCKKLFTFTMPKLLGDKLLMKYREDLPDDSLLRPYV